VLLAVLILLTVAQFHWAERMAAADAQREREHLDTATSLFASEFKGIAGEAMRFLENDAWNALQSGERLAGVPKLIGELYYLDFPAQAAPRRDASRPRAFSYPLPFRNGYRFQAVRRSPSSSRPCSWFRSSGGRTPVS